MQSAANELNSTTIRRPKYSLMRSVITKTTGHNKTPAVKFISPTIPSFFQPNKSLSEKILTPINSANKAWVKKTNPKTKNKMILGRGQDRSEGVVISKKTKKLQPIRSWFLVLCAK